MSTLPLFERGDGEADQRVYRVGQLNRMARALLEGRFGDVWVEGELSDVSQAASGHVYFSLNDEREQAQVRAVMFRSDARRAKAKLEDGARVKLRGRLSLYEPRGSYQLIAQIALPLGLGELHAEFERVRKKLDAEGLLASERKRALPRRTGSTRCTLVEAYTTIAPGGSLTRRSAWCSCRTSSPPS
jgi:exodeoxyribonuclease VII large subunit